MHTRYLCLAAKAELMLFMYENKMCFSTGCVGDLHETFNQILQIWGFRDHLIYSQERARQLLFQLIFQSHRTLHNQKMKEAPAISKTELSN